MIVLLSLDRVTCRDWFQLSLKEGLTVFRDQVRIFAVVVTLFQKLYQELRDLVCFETTKR